MRAQDVPRSDWSETYMRLQRQLHGLPVDILRFRPRCGPDKVATRARLEVLEDRTSAEGNALHLKARGVELDVVAPERVLTEGLWPHRYLGAAIKSANGEWVLIRLRQPTLGSALKSLKAAPIAF